MSYETLDYCSRVRKSCLDFAQSNASNLVQLNLQRAIEYAITVNAEEIRHLGSTLGFSQIEHEFEESLDGVKLEAGFVTFLHAIDFGGGFRQELHKFHGKGAFQTIKPGGHELLKRNPGLDAKMMASMTKEEVADCFGLKTSVTDEYGLEFFIDGLTDVINELGLKTLEAGHAKLGDFVYNSVEGYSKENVKQVATKTVEFLATNFPISFNDVYQIKATGRSGSTTRDVYFYKKAQLVVGELYHTLHLKTFGSVFNFSDIHDLTAYCDNVICAVARKLGIVTVSPEFKNMIESHQNVPKGSEYEVALRANSLAAVEIITNEVNKALPINGERIFAADLGSYFWGTLGKVPEFRKFNRHATRDTTFY